MSLINKNLVHFSIEALQQNEGVFRYYKFNDENCSGYELPYPFDISANCGVCILINNNFIKVNIKQMAYRKFYIKVKGIWSKKFEWNPSNEKLYYDYSLIGNAPSPQDAIEIAKSNCGADRDSVVYITD